MNKQTFILVIVFLISAPILFTNCESDYRKYEITRISEKETLTLEHTNSRAKVHRIEILISGSINGNATLIQKDGHSFVNPFELAEGEIDTVLISEWYSTSCILEYEPGTCTEGWLEIKCKFFSF